MAFSISTVVLERETDVVLARRSARLVASLLHFDEHDQTRIATAVSEIARNAYQYGVSGRVDFVLEGETTPQVLSITVSDDGPGFTEIDTVPSAKFKSNSGSALGIRGARRLMDQFTIGHNAKRGSKVVLKKTLPPKAPIVDKAASAAITATLDAEVASDAIGELHRQNQELMTGLEELQRRRDQLQDVNRELQDTNRGVVALYAELDERAEHLKRADELKTRFLSNMSHEFRTPLNSILALTKLLQDNSDGTLSPEQSKQIGYIGKSAASLAEMVDDLLDLAKVEAGKAVVRPSPFLVNELFGALRGMLKPLLVRDTVDLVFDDIERPFGLFTDEGKVSQILRNFISNALKFTERGEVRVSARLTRGERVIFAVKDTGVGIEQSQQEEIFREFSQIDSPIQKRVKGTGLGLPLCRRLAGLLGGTVSLQSEPQKGSTFYLDVPVEYRDRKQEPLAVSEQERGRLPVVVIGDNPADILSYESMLRASIYQLITARTVESAHQAIAVVQPRAIVIDVRFLARNPREVLAKLKRAMPARDIPMIVAGTGDDTDMAMTLGAAAFARKPISRHWLVSRLDAITGGLSSREKPKVLLIDDDEVSRYLIRHYMSDLPYCLREASSANDGLRQLMEVSYDAIFLDLSMPDLSGYEVLERIKQGKHSQNTPVIVVTSALEKGRDRRLAQAHSILSKNDLSKDVIARVLAGACNIEARHGA